MGTIEILKNVSAVLLLLTGVCFCYQTVYLAVSLFWKEPRHKPEKPTRYAVLIAARNEEAVLPYLLQSIRAQDYPAERIGVYVVADNCTASTAPASARATPCMSCWNGCAERASWTAGMRF